MILNICYISYINSYLFDIYIMKEKVEVLIAQFNSVVGDLEGNTNRIINIIKQNRSLNSKKIIIFPELAFVWLFTRGSSLEKRLFSCN